MKLTTILQIVCTCCCKKIAQQCKLKQEFTRQPWKKLKFDSFRNFRFKVVHLYPNGDEDEVTSNFLWVLNEYHTLDYDDNIILEYDIVKSFFPGEGLIKIEKTHIDDTSENNKTTGVIGLSNKEITSIVESFGQLTIIPAETPVK
jgi:uncharacterized protein YggL (DUF469 family)